MTEKESLEQLMVYQQDLQLEEECLKKIISKLNTQAHALQVEQLHILNAIKRKQMATINNENKTNGVEVPVKKEPELQELNLTVPTFQDSEEEMDED